MDATAVVENATGSFGRWQLMLIIVLYASKFAVAWHQTNVVIIAPPAKFNCTLPDIDACATECPGHVFDKSVFSDTIIMKWDLVCSRKWIPNCSQTLSMFGILIGNYIFGSLADKFGRKWPFIIAIIIQVGAGTLCAIIPWLWVYIFVRFISNTATGGTMLISFVILMEIIAKKHREIVGVLFQLPFFVGYAMLGGIGYFIRNWVYSQLAITLPNALLFIYICVLPESPRWLMIHGRIDHAVKVLETAAKCNKRPIDNIRSEVTAVVTNMQDTNKGKFVDLFRTKRMRCKTLSLAMNWFSISFATYATLIYVGRLSGDIFYNITVAGFMQVPGIAVVIPIMMFWGRKTALIISYLLAFVPWFVIIFLPVNPPWPTNIMAACSLVGCCMCFCVIYVITGEIFPTGVRNTGMGMVSAISRIGSMLSSQVLLLEDVQQWLPAVFLSGLPCFSMIVLIFFIPETLHRQLPDSVEEADLS